MSVEYDVMLTLKLIPVGSVLLWADHKLHTAGNKM